MRQFRSHFLLFLVAVAVILTGCFPIIKKDYAEIPPMLTILTNKAQLAVEEGYFDKGEQAVLDFIEKKNPGVTKWFSDRNYRP